ncbi:glutamate ABC transporter permease [Advenella kashmirensis W13003]|uniref:Glutamate ABC transporter permease n=1 Tax=Advenella kashmirensis W13003 TaxID=1424334 RepID=V8QN30_9BURK|nr:amino acid ABC transporter permease [Advenella kashmirensis]ETF00715.1 glutamate ABC transporter permease [Advenella kashmirensis W13003]
MSISTFFCDPANIDNASLFCQMSPSGNTYLDAFGTAVLWTLELSAIAWVLAFVVGVLVGVGLTSQNRLVARICSGYVELFRNIPLLVQLFLWYYVVPQVLPASLGKAIIGMPYPSSVFWPAVLCLGLFTSSRIAIQLSSGIRSLPRGQSMAATALGLTRFQMYKYVLLPMAMRIITPPLTSEMLNLLKNSSVAYTIGLLEITGAAASMQESTFQTFPSYMAATALYVIINLLILVIMSAVERFFSVPGFISGKG